MQRQPGPGGCHICICFLIETALTMFSVPALQHMCMDRCLCRPISSKLPGILLHGMCSGAYIEARDEVAKVLYN